MFKSIFYKYFMVVVVAILASFLALCGTQLFLSTRYWVNDKRESLYESANLIAQYTADNTAWGRTGAPVLDSRFYNGFEILSATSTGVSNIMLADAAGNIIAFSNASLGLASGDTIRENLLRQLAAGESESSYFGSGTLDGLFDEPQYTVCVPVVVDGRLAWYIFTSASSTAMTQFLVNNLQVFLLAALGVLALTFIAVYVMTYRLVRPLRQMALATRRFSEGDFSARLPVRGQDEVAELADSLNHMAVSLSSLEEMRRSFVTNVSHELKTPMTSIAGFIDGILDGTIEDDRRNYYLTIISDEVKRLSRLVKTMLDLSRIDSGQLRLTPVKFDLTESTCNILLTFERRIEEKSITITGLPELPRTEVHADYDLIGQVIYNLTDNAVKFTSKSGTITFGIERRENRIFWRIRNTGAGIPVREMPYIFERFYKTDKSRSLDKNGVGLGLYIVRSVINMHGGEIAVRSSESEYCEFEFWLPAAPARKTSDVGG